MKKLFEDAFIYIGIDEKKSLVSYIYKEGVKKEMTDEDFKTAMTRYAEVTEQYKPAKLLVDSKFSTYTIVPAMQEWVAQKIAPRTISLQRMAFVVSTDIFVHVSLEQMMDEGGIADKYSKPRFFEEVNEAEKWLME
ncbi:MAG: hypothetical protein EAZ08_09420 [Cytophagales bacterium]|nr:MAG: hypothetical protein EAZ08_09420 [Cytophagales bacterium]